MENRPTYNNMLNRKGKESVSDKQSNKYCNKEKEKEICKDKNNSERSRHE